MPAKQRPWSVNQSSVMIFARSKCSWQLTHTWLLRICSEGYPLPPGKSCFSRWAAASCQLRCVVAQ